MVGLCHGGNKRLGHDDGDDDGKDGDDERALLLAEHNYLFVRGLPLAALHLVATDLLCKSCNLFLICHLFYFYIYNCTIKLIILLHTLQRLIKGYCLQFVKKKTAAMAVSARRRRVIYI